MRSCLGLPGVFEFISRRLSERKGHRREGRREAP